MPLTSKPAMNKNDMILDACVIDAAYEGFEFFDYPFSQEIWASKYSNNGKDKDYLATFDRVAKAIASVESEEVLRSKWEERFKYFMEMGILAPAGRILAGAGTSNRVTLVNCFVNETVADSMEGIMHALANTALTMQQGGGMGTDFSTIRPSGALLKRTGSEASGPLPFMDTWNAMCQTIMSAGSRRGAMMGTLRDTHPDLLEFITAKRTPGRLNMFNMSILISDKFMKAVQEDKDWLLFFHEPPAVRDPILMLHDFTDHNGVLQYAYAVHKATTLFEIITKSTYEYAEPGVIFIDRVNSKNNLRGFEDIASTNPCGEEPLPPNGACNLGSIVVSLLVEDPFKKTASFNWHLFDIAVRVGMRFLDNVVDVSAYPLDVQKEEQRLKRRTGLGMTGVADVLIMLGLRYGSKEAAEFVSKLGQQLQHSAYSASAALAEEKGHAPIINNDKQQFMHNLRELPLRSDVLRNIEKHGLRNTVMLTMAPTGTTSIFYGNGSASFEPNFMFSYDRKVLNNDGSFTKHRVESFIQRFSKHVRGIETTQNDLLGSEAWVSVPDLSVQDHLAIQVAIQHWIDASVSKTINCPEDMPYHEFQNVYLQAWEDGLKGCTTYRPSEIRGSILSAPDEEPKKIEVQLAIDTTELQEYINQELVKEGYRHIEPKQRPSSLKGETFKLKWPGISSAVYMTVNSSPDGSPFEVFFASKDSKYSEWTTALSLTLTSLFRLGIDPTFILKEFQSIKGQVSSYIDGRRYDSFLAYIGQLLDQHINGVTPITSDSTLEEDASLLGAIIIIHECPECGVGELVNQSGCMTCSSCGHSKC